MKKNITQIIVLDGRIYIPTTAQYSNGIYTYIEPVHIVQPVVDEINSVINNNMSKEPTILQDPSPEEVKSQSNFLPKKTGAKNWKKLYQNGISYIISNSEKGVTLFASRLDSKGRWEFDPDRQKEYSKDIPLNVVIQDMLNDFAARPK